MVRLMIQGEVVVLPAHHACEVECLLNARFSLRRSPEAVLLAHHHAC